MRKVKYLLIGLAVAGMMTGCGKNADSEAVNGTEVQSTVEEMSSTAASEMTSEAAPTEITTEPVAQTSLPEEDEIYNYGMISGLGIDQEDARKATAYLSGLSYGRITSTERIELAGRTYIELKNNEQIVIYLYLLSDGKIKEITDKNLNTLLVISGDSDSNNTAQPSATQNNGTTSGAASNSQPEMIEEPLFEDIGNGLYPKEEPVFGDYHNGLGYLEEEPVVGDYYGLGEHVE